MYSICTVLTGATTCRRGFLAPFSAFQVTSTVSSSVRERGAASTLLKMALARDLIRRLSVRRLAMGAVSITGTPTLSSSFASSIFSRKLKTTPPASGGCFMVTSLRKMFLIVF